MSDGKDEKKTDVESILEHLKILLPIIANKLMGKEVFPAKMDRELYLMSSLLETLTAQQQKELRDMLSPQQLSVLTEFNDRLERRIENEMKIRTDVVAETASQRDARLCHDLILRLKDEGLDPRDTVYVLLASAATVALISSNSERTDFEQFAGEVFVQFAKSSDDVRGRR